ncbi:MAG: DMT family transporter [Pantoea sp.]|uniref:DMT family transporter n=1 Tax=Pantoea sp. TaxID=69393 RepID=UPI00238D45E8|nr:DMT family transporter [Pantoea sp.]MDE1187861.1 DMT family transporter [Pantoea sp.]
MAFAAYAVYAFSDASVKILHGSLPAYQVTFIGSLFGIGALPFLKTKSDQWTDLLRTTNRRLWLLRFFFGAIASICSVVAFTKLPMAEAFALLFLLPSFVTILSVIFLKEDVRWQRWTAVVIGFVGVLVILRPGFRELSIGHLCAAIGGFTSAVSIVIFRALGPSEKRLSLYSAALFGVLIVSGLLMLPEMRVPTAQEWIWLAGYGVFGTIGNVLLMLAARMAPASLVAPPQYSQMIWAIIFGYLIFEDSIDLPMALGIALIVFSGLMTLIRERVRKTSLPPSVAGASNPAAVVNHDEVGKNA